jgi:alkylated DNA repair dioxygenase AlkB
VLGVAMLQRTLLGGGEPQVDERARFERIHLDEASWIDVARGWLLGADTLLDVLIERVAWKQGRRRMYERMLDDPRLSHWYRRGQPLPDPALDTIGAHLDADLGVRLSGPACNYYRDGTDSVAWHADRELRELSDTRIAIVTLGARRPFLIRPKGRGKSRNLAPESGDLLVMGGACQMSWEHSVPKTKSAGPRISCSWRWTCSSVRGSTGPHPQLGL